MTQCIQRTVTQAPDGIDPVELSRQYLEVIGQLLDRPDDPAVLQRVRRLIDDHLAREERRGRLCRVSYGVDLPYRHAV